MTEPDNLVLHLLREIRAEMATKSDLAGVRAELKGDIASLQSEVRSLRADVASDLVRIEANAAATEKRLVEQIAGLRRAVMEYHSTVIGHGILYSDLEERVRRIESRLEIAP